MRGRQLLELVAKRRIDMIQKEVEHCFPGASARYEMKSDGRAHISILWEDQLIGEEFIESGESWNKPERMKEYRRVLQSKIRLVVIVPERHARTARLKLLDLNHWWLLYYLIFSYDMNGEIKKVGRPMYCFPDQGYA